MNASQVQSKRDAAWSKLSQTRQRLLKLYQNDNEKVKANPTYQEMKRRWRESR